MADLTAKVGQVEWEGLKQELMKADVDQMARSLKELQHLVEKREENRVAIIDKRMSEMAGEIDYLKW